MWQESPARQASVVLRRQAQPIAEAIVTRIYATEPEAALPIDEETHAKSVRDVGYHLRYLAEALWADDVQLFLNYTDWAAELFAGLGFPDTMLVGTLVQMQAEMHTRFASPQLEAIDSYLIAATTRLETSPPLSPQLDESQPYTELAAEYLRLLLDGKRLDATHLILSTAQRGVPVADIYLHVFQSTQREIGRLWQINQISIAQEHYATAATQFVMAQLYPYIFSGPRCHHRLVATSVGNELHELGVRMVADFFEMAGWDTYYLGANTPASSVVRAVVDYRADLLAISATLTPHIAHVVDLIGETRRLLQPPVILVGGFPFNLSPTLWRQVGADGTAPDARSAVELATRLVA